MTLKQIRDDILARIGPDHEIQNSEVDTFINEGYHHIIGKIMDDFQDYYGDTETIATVIGTQEYTPTKEFIAIRFVDYDPEGDGTFVSAKPIQPSDLKTVRDDTSLGSFVNTQPKYYLWGDKIGLKPIPTVVGSLKIYGIVKPADLSADSDIPAFLSTHHNLLTTWGMKCMVESVDENYIDGQRKMAEFEAGAEELLRLIGARQSNEAKKITVTPLY